MVADAVEGGSFDHDAGQGLGARETNHDAAGFAELFIAGADSGLDRVELFERAFFAKADVDQGLGENRQGVGERIEGGAFPHHDVEQAEHGQHAVASGGLFVENDVAGLFAADVGAEADHLFENVLIADGGTSELDAAGLEGQFEAEVGHDRRDDGIGGEGVAVVCVAAADE